MARWGATLRRASAAAPRFEDVATGELGYFTDNGAMLYGDAWHHELDCCNETVLKKVKRGLDEQDVPIRWIQLDDWWYKGFLPQGGGVFCTQDWVPFPAAFPSGLDKLQADMGGLPWLLYAPFFCANSTYVKQNPTDMLVSPGGYAVPTPEASARFYARLFKGYAGKLAGYEVDFMIDNFLNQRRFREELGAAQAWLDGMHAAAQDVGISIQYCMALPSDLLASVSLPHVTNYRASDDYAGSSVSNFNLQTSSLLGYSLALRPSKDVFFTSDNMPQNPYIHRLNANHRSVPGLDNELNSLIATLSTGPVAIGDGPGHTDRLLVMRSCRSDGRLLQPDKPLTAIDAMYDGRAKPQGGFAAAGGAQVWTTFSRVSEQHYHMLLSIDVEAFHVHASRDFYPALEANGSAHVYLWQHTLTRNCLNGSLAVAGGCAMDRLPALDDSKRPRLPFDAHRWSLLYAMPVLQNGWVFVGEPTEKWVPVAARRFQDVTGAAQGLVVKLDAVKGERLSLTALRPHAASMDREWEVVRAEVVGVGGAQTVCIGRC